MSCTQMAVAWPLFLEPSQQADRSTRRTSRLNVAIASPATMPQKERSKQVLCSAHRRYWRNTGGCRQRCVNGQATQPGPDIASSRDRFQSLPPFVLTPLTMAMATGHSIVVVQRQKAFMLIAHPLTRRLQLQLGVFFAAYANQGKWGACGALGIQNQTP